MEGMNGYHISKAESEVKDPVAIEGILRRCKWMSIALSSEDGPYIITLSYGYDRERNALYFHTSRKGLKLEVIRKDPRACGTVVEDLGYIHGKCDHAYRSLVMFGRISFVDGPEEMSHAFDVLLSHLERDPDAVRRELLSGAGASRSVQILRFDIEGIRCKQGGGQIV
jgi:nitroimidazol reductase NimA-like FMN-containing flavoprotein (pyridoxamine 5'-phosphate oxidase superfamily)